MNTQKLEEKYEGMIPDAMLFAFNAHSGQYRKALPQQYIIHPLRVSEFLLKNFSSHPSLEDMRVAAILHDTIEDTWVTEKDIEHHFGKKIAGLVSSLTHAEEKERKEKLNNYVLLLKNSSDESKIIKLADIFDNVVLSTDDASKWKDFLEDCETVVGCIELNESNPQFEKIKSELQKIINRKLKKNE